MSKENAAEKLTDPEPVLEVLCKTVPVPDPVIKALDLEDAEIKGLLDKLGISEGETDMDGLTVADGDPLPLDTCVGVIEFTGL